MVVAGRWYSEVVSRETCFNIASAARDIANAGQTLAMYPWLRMFMLVPAVLAYRWQRSQAQQDQNALFRARRHNLAGPLLLPGVGFWVCGIVERGASKSASV